MSNATGWPEVSVGDICEFRYGKSLPDAARVTGSYAVFGSNGIVGSHTEALTDGAAIVVGRKGSFGEVHLSLEPCWPIDTTYYIDTTATSADLKWLAYALATLDLKALNRAAAVPGLNRTDAYRKRLSLPPIDEQRRIAEVLDRAEALRAKRRETIAHLDTLTQSMFFEMFGDTSKNAKQWPQVTLSDVILGRPDNGIFRKNPEYAEDGRGLPVIWVEELFRGPWIDASASRRVIPTESEISKYGLQNGDILFCRSSLKLDGIAFNNVYLGQDDGALFECSVIRVQPDAEVVSSLYLNALLRSPEMRAIAKAKSNTATMTTIDQDAVCSLPVMLPPRQAQEQYALRLVELERLRTTYSASLTYLDALFASLQHRAFRGEL